MEELDDLLEKYKKSRKSFLYGTDFTAEKRCIWRGIKSGSTHCSGIYYGAFADISNAFPSFMTISRIFKYSCFHVFHIIYPEESIWKSIPSQMKMFKIFPDFIQESSIMKVFLSN